MKVENYEKVILYFIYISFVSEKKILKKKEENLSVHLDDSQC